jgi:ribosomal protein S18 acetylase RimI-like enzyme
LHLADKAKATNSFQNKTLKTTMDIRKATIDDCTLISTLASEVFPYTYREILTEEQIEYMMEWMYSLPNIRKQMEVERHTYYIAYSDAGTPCGYVSVRPEAEGLYHLEKIYVLPKAQKEGYGKALFLKAEEHVREQEKGKPAAMELNVNRYNPALGFYKKMGMRCVREGDFPIGNGFYMNDYIMRIDVQ